MMRLMTVLVAISCVLFSVAGPISNASADGSLLTLATTTSTDNSGLLAHIHPDFEKRTGIRVKVIAKGTGASLQLGRDGNADIVLVHARKHEEAFVAEGFGVGRADVMYNDFVIIGPKSDPAKVGDAADAADALKRIAKSNQEFVSRGDASGTHIKEQDLWKATELPLINQQRTLIKSGSEMVVSMVRPQGSWYKSIGQGMGATLNYATERGAYTLADRGTFYAYSLANPPRTDLVILSEGDRRLANPYGVIAVNPRRHSEVNYSAAKKYIEWITSPATQKMINQFKVGGKVLFYGPAQ